MSTNPDDRLQVPDDQSGPATPTRLSSAGGSGSHSPGRRALQGRMSRGASCSGSRANYAGVQKNNSASPSSSSRAAWKSSKGVIIFDEANKKTCFASTMTSASTILGKSPDWMTGRIKACNSTENGRGVLPAELSDGATVWIGGMTGKDTEAVAKTFANDSSGDPISSTNSNNEFDTWLDKPHESHPLLQHLQLSSFTKLEQDGSFWKTKAQSSKTPRTISKQKKGICFSTRPGLTKVYLVTTKSEAIVPKLLNYKSTHSLNNALKQAETGFFTANVQHETEMKDQPVWVTVLDHETMAEIEKLTLENGETLWNKWLDYDDLPAGFPGNLQKEAVRKAVTKTSE